ncbi:MAG: hypothetical protein V3U86_10205 [Acidobacteriota bacterium]
MSAHSHRQGRSEAARAIWDWRGVKDATAGPQHRRRVQLRAGVQTLVAAGLGALFFAFGSRILPFIIWGIAGLLLAVALSSPDRLYLRVQNFMDYLGRAVGTILTWILLVPLFYLFFTPFGLLMRPGSRDRLERRLESAAPTYWKKKTGTPRSPDSYRRQF